MDLDEGHEFIEQILVLLEYDIATPPPRWLRRTRVSKIDLSLGRLTEDVKDPRLGGEGFDSETSRRSIPAARLA